MAGDTGGSRPRRSLLSGAVHAGLLQQRRPAGGRRVSGELLRQRPDSVLRAPGGLAPVRAIRGARTALLTARLLRLPGDAGGLERESFVVVVVDTSDLAGTKLIHDAVLPLK